jgi:prevent-host-death family protein
MSAIKTVNMHEAKSSLSKLVEEALSGREIVLARAGKPMVRLTPVTSAKRRKLGQWKGKVRMSKDFDSPLSTEHLAAWEGKARTESCV